MLIIITSILIIPLVLALCLFPKRVRENVTNKLKRFFVKLRSIAKGRINGKTQ